ncbi:MAG: type III pantothenate kinase [Burkholderiales bacterium]
MTVLAIDVGNSRIKWGFHHQGEWLSMGALPRADSARLASVWADNPAPHRVVGCNVAGEEAGREIGHAVAARGCQVEWIVSRANQCGVANRYDEPSQLGADRWAALIGARKRVAGGCVVLSAGTAVTIDAMSAQGEFLGGVILPNPSIMAEALERHTAALKRQRGKFHLLPTNTADAIATGAYLAVGGALNRIENTLRTLGEASCEIVMTGGGAADLQPTLDRNAKLIPNLVLEGLAVVASQRD